MIRRLTANTGRAHHYRQDESYESMNGVSANEVNTEKDILKGH
jgi:hypothetical protein